ncbi:MAG: hypothetical protein RQ758_01060 [Methanomicrobiaceae archaeon]|nr:hypothetical protein [Methanomicrobiaceae archaeon]
MMRPVRPVSFLFLLLLLAPMLAGCASGPRVVYPELNPAEGPPATEDTSFTFVFQDREVSLDLPVDLRVYVGAKEAVKEATLFGSVKDDVWIEGYFRAFMDDPDLNPLYEAILEDLREVRSDSSLDDDEYLELIAVFVQSIPYHTNPAANHPKFPIETVVEWSGDCDDKSLLLAPLLSREGYDVALLFFDQEDHMALGVRSEGCIFKNTGYAFLETTNVTLVTLPPKELEGAITLASAPRVIPLGSGTKSYTRCDQILRIEKAEMEAFAQMEAQKPDLAALEDTLSMLQGDLETLRNAGRLGEYNRKVSEYNATLKEYNRLVGEFNRNAELYNAIASRQYDREGLSLLVTGNAG